MWWRWSRCLRLECAWCTHLAYRRGVPVPGHGLWLHSNEVINRAKITGYEEIFYAILFP